MGLGLKREVVGAVTDKDNLDGWLFGENLGERVKAAAALDRSAKDLKVAPVKPAKTKKLANRPLNSKGPSRYRSRRPMASNHLCGPHHPYPRQAQDKRGHTYSSQKNRRH